MAMYVICFLHTDETAPFVTNSTDLYPSLKVFFNYCNKWKLKINANETKIIILLIMETITKKIFTLGNHDRENMK